MTLQVHLAKPEDKDVIADLLEYCYDYPRPALEGMKTRFDGMAEQHICGSIDGNIQSALRLIPLNQNLRGCFKGMGGIANVVSAPEFRQRGYVTQMMVKTYEEMKAKGMSVSTLYPFKDSFYHQYGYINVGSFEYIEINPAWFVKWKKIPEGYTIVRKRTKDAMKEFQAMQECHMDKVHGGVKRPELRWMELTSRAISWVVCVYNPEHQLEGMMHFKPSGFGYKVFGENIIGKFSSVEFHVKSLKAQHALFHFIYLNRDQIHRVNFPNYNDGFNYFNWISDHATTKTHLHMINLARIVDVFDALNQIPVRNPHVLNNHSESLEFTVSDEMCNWNDGSWKISVVDKKIFIEKIGKEVPESNFTIEGITALLYGTMSVEEIEYNSWLKNCSPTLKHKWQALFPQQAYCNTEFF